MSGHLVGDGPCDDCGGLNIVWFTDDLLWNRVIRDNGPERILCVHCFVGRAEEIYKISAWRLIVAPELVPKWNMTQEAASAKEIP